KDISFGSEPNQHRAFLHQNCVPSARLLATTNAVTFLVATNAKIDIRSLQFQKLEDKVLEFREPLYRERQIEDWLYQKRVQSFDEMTDLAQEFRSRLAEQFDFSKSEIGRASCRER